MTHRVILLLLVGIAGLACASVPRVSLGRRTEPVPWDADQVARLALEIETLVRRASMQSEERIVDQVGTELEFGEDEVDPAALMGALDDLAYEAPTLVELRLDTPAVAGAIRARQLRAPTLWEWKGRRCVGESSDGKAVYVQCPACETDPVLGDRLAFLIIKENRNRRAVYETLQKENRWSRRRVPEIRAAFAAAIRSVAGDADLFQDGENWVAKDPEAGDAPAVPAPRPPVLRRRPVHRPENWEQADVFEQDVGAVPPRVVPQR